MVVTIELLRWDEIAGLDGLLIVMGFDGLAGWHGFGSVMVFERWAGEPLERRSARRWGIPIYLLIGRHL